MKDLLNLLSPAITINDYDSPMRQEALRVVAAMIKLALVSEVSLPALQTAIGALQDAKDDIDDAIMLIEEEEGLHDQAISGDYGEAEEGDGSLADLIVKALDVTQDPNKN